MVTADVAARRVVARVQAVDAERIELISSLGRVLSEPVTSPLALPPWDNSAMDGYAVRSADVAGRATAETPVLLSIIEEIPAGAFPVERVGPGQAARIFTGAPVPTGADCVIRQEDTERRDDRVAILTDRDSGRNVRPRGEDIAMGDEVLPRGTEIGPAQIGVLASVAARDIAVYRRPRVGILSTGDEIADLEEREAILDGRKIASSNGYSIAASVLRSGGEPIDLGIARDTAASLRNHLRDLSTLDLLITTAGVSVGEHDHVRSVLDELGLVDAFWRVQMRPGSPFGFGMLAKLPWLGLPGNPVSAMVTYELFGHPVVRRLAGHQTPFRRTVDVEVGQEIRLGPELRHFLRCRLADGEHGPVATLTGPQGSGLLTSMAKADALLIVPETMAIVPVGARLRALRLDDPRHTAEPEI